MNSIKDFLLKLICSGDGNISMLKFLAFFGYFVFSIGSLYLLVNNINWDSYPIFASYTGGGGAVLQFADKFMDSKYNSMPGSYPTYDGNKCSTPFIPINNSKNNEVKACEQDKK